MNTNSNITQEQLEAIERYIDGSMSDIELKGFEKQLEDSEFRKLVEDVKTMILGIEAQSLSENLEEFHKDLDTNASTEKSPAKVRYLMVRTWIAAAAIVISAGSFVWFLIQNPNDELYSKYFSPDPGLPTTMSTEANYEFYDAMVDYKQGNYLSAIDKWEKLSSNDTINYFIGVAHLAEDNKEQAILYLEKSVQNKDFPLLSDAHYYLGLAYLKEGKLDRAKTQLEQSDNSDSAALLSELE